MHGHTTYFHYCSGPNVGNFAVTTPTTTKATFTWDDSNGTHSFMRIKARVDVTDLHGSM